MKFLLSIIFSLFFVSIYSQSKKINNLKQKIEIEKNDTIKALMYDELSEEYSSETDYEKAKYYADKCLILSKRNKFSKGIVMGLKGNSTYYVRKQNPPRALKYIFEAYEITQDNPLLKKENIMILVIISFVYTSFDDYKNAIIYRELHVQNLKELLNNKVYRRNNSMDINKDSLSLCQSISSIAFYHLKLKDYDSSLLYGRQSIFLLNQIDKKDASYLAYVMNIIGTVESQLGNYDNALNIFRESLVLSEKSTIPKNKITVSYKSLWEIAIIKNKINQLDSSIFFAKKALSICENLKWKKDEVEIVQLLADNYSVIDYKEAIYYFKRAKNITQELNDKQKAESLFRISAEEEERQIEILEQKRIQQKLLETRIQYATIALVIILCILSFLILSKKVIKNDKIISFLTTITLLLIFEFFNLISSPLIAEITENIPFLTFISAIILALILSPFHNLLGGYLNKKMLK